MGNTPARPASDIEAGYTTTEFWVSSVSAFVLAFFGVLAAFGLPLTAEQKMTVIAVIPASISIIAGAYALGRSLRKRA